MKTNAAAWMRMPARLDAAQSIAGPGEAMDGVDLLCKALFRPSRG